MNVNKINFVAGQEYLDVQKVEIMIYYAPAKDNRSYFYNKHSEALCIRPNKVFAEISTPNQIRTGISTLRT